MCGQIMGNGRRNINVWLGPGAIRPCSPCKQFDYQVEINILCFCIFRLLQWLSSKESICNAGDAGDMGSISGSGRSSGGGYSNTLQYFCWKNPMDRGAWQVMVHGVPKSWTRLKRLSMHFQQRIGAGLERKAENTKEAFPRGGKGVQCLLSPYCSPGILSMKKYIILPILWMRKLKLREVQKLAKYCTASKWQSWDLNVENVISEPIFTSTKLPWFITITVKGKEDENLIHLQLERPRKVDRLRLQFRGRIELADGLDV